MFEKFNVITCIFMLFVSCSTEKNNATIEGKKDYFNKLLGNTQTGQISEHFETNSLSFLRSQLQEVNKSKLFDWIQAGPNNIGGHTDAIAVDARNSKLILVGAQTGGIWKTTDKGDSWQFKTSPNFSLGVSSIAQHSKDKNTWFYTADALFKSTDNGDSWVKIKDRTDFGHAKTIDKVMVHPKTGDVLVYAYGAIYKSSDKGNKFEKITNCISSEGFQIADDGKIYVLKNDDKSTSGGGGEKGLFVSSDNGDTFTKKMDIPQEALVLGLSKFRIPAKRSDIAWFIGYDMNGESKKALKVDLVKNSIEDKSNNLMNISTYGGHCFIFEVKPDDPNTLIIGGIELYKITDGLKKAVNVSKAFITGIFPKQHVDQQSFCWDPQNANVCWSGHDGGISYADNIQTITPEKWVNKNNKYITTQFYAVAIPIGRNDNRVFGGTQDNGSIFIKFDQKNYLSPNPMQADGFSCHFGKQYIYESMQIGRIFGTPYNKKGYADRNATPLQLTPDITGQPFFTKFVVDPEEKYMIYMSGSSLYRKNNLTDQSSTWTRLDKLDMFSMSTISVSNNNILYYAGGNDDGNAKAYRLENCNTATSGAIDITPPNMNNGGRISNIAISLSNSSETMLCVANEDASSIHYSKDKGSSYGNVTGNLNGPSIISVLISKLQGKDLYWAGTSAGLYCTDKLDGNKTKWKIVAPEKFGLAKIMDLKTRLSDGIVAVATYGRGIVVGRPNTSSVYEAAIIDYDFLDQNYPNPFRQSTNIKYNIKEAGNVLLEVFDINGRKIQTLSNKYHHIGKYEVEFDGSNLPSGEYLYKIHVNDLMYTKKMILAR